MKRPPPTFVYGFLVGFSVVTALQCPTAWGRLVGVIAIVWGTGNIGFGLGRAKALDLFIRTVDYVQHDHDTSDHPTPKE